MKVYLLWGIEPKIYNDMRIDNPFVFGVYTDYNKAYEAQQRLLEVAGSIEEQELIE